MKNTKYSIKEIKESLPEDKNKGDSFFVRFFARKVSFIFTYVFVNAGFSAKDVSLISIFVGLLSCLCLCINVQVFRVIGIVGIEIWMILDCTDGNIARLTKTFSPYGEFIDALSGYIISAFSLFGIGVSAFYTANIVFGRNEIYLIIGGISSICNILPRLIYQKYLVSECIANNRVVVLEERKSEINEINFSSIRRRLEKEIGMSGLFMVLIIFSILYEIFDLISIIYFIFTTIGCLIVLIRYIIIDKQV